MKRQLPVSGLDRNKRLASGLPERQLTALDISRLMYNLQTRRRNLALKRQTMQQRLERFDVQIQQIDEQLAALHQQDNVLREAAERDATHHDEQDDDIFDLRY